MEISLNLSLNMIKIPYPVIFLKIDGVGQTFIDHRETDLTFFAYGDNVVSYHIVYNNIYPRVKVAK
jgi:hypothetical protein